MPVVNIVNIPGARAAVFALFALKKWDKLPHLSVLLVDEDAAVLFRDPFSLSRAQIQYQFAIWLRTGGLVGAESSTLGDGQITATVDSRVGSSPELLQRTFAAVLRGPLVGCRPTFMPEVLKALIHDKHCNVFWESRVVELKSFVIKNFARRASSVRSHSSAFEMAINKSRSKWKKEWVGQARPAYVTTAFLSASMLDAYELVARNVDTLILLTFDFIDRELCAQFRKLFGPRGTARALVIPPFPGNEANSELVQQTLAYIAGGALSALQKASTVCEDSDSTLSALLKTFVATHSITKKSAGASGVPMKVIVDRSNGGLIFPSLEMFSLIVLIEHVFSSLLTMENVLAYGGEIISELYRLTRESVEIQEAFDTCMGPVRETARSSGFTGVDGAPLLEKVLKLYMRIRGKDAVKTLVSDLKQSAIANSMRGKLAATAAAHDKKHCSKGRSSEFDSKHSDEFDALDMDLAEVTEEFSREPDNTPDAVALTLPGSTESTSSVVSLTY